MATVRKLKTLPYFTFGDFSSDSAGLYVGTADTYNAPAQDLSDIVIPGRNGSYLVSNDRYENVDVVVHVGIFKDLDAYVDPYTTYRQTVTDALLSSQDYQKLHFYGLPEAANYYRLAVVKSGIEWNVFRNRYSTADITFSCRPEKWLDAGSDEIAITSNRYIINPTKYPARPVITFKGSGTITIERTTVTVASNSVSALLIDCEAMNCSDIYRNVSHNELISLNGYVFPVLQPGENYIAFSSGISNLKITPRWYVL